MFFMITLIFAVAGCYASVPQKFDALDIKGDESPSDVGQDVIFDVIADPGHDIILDDILDGNICYSNGDCSLDSFCEFPPGTCSGPGVCISKGYGPCPDIYAPVCGCDGVTYGNDCMRMYAGVSLLHTGECSATVCYPWVPESCPEGEFCDGPPGMCQIEGINGWCVEIPVECDIFPDPLQPVCGCDGKTYNSDCERQQAGIWLNHYGPCENTTPCFPGDPYHVCSPGEFCEGPEGMCDMVGISGWCQIPETDCGYLYDPVCGCDGVTYRNDCERQRRGVWRRHRGECETTNRNCGPALPPCPRRSFCEYPVGDCGDSGLNGTCVEIPEMCPEYYSPVCGCDGRTYDNDCYRQNARVSKLYDGPCLPDEP